MIIPVLAGGDLQAALDSAQAGDTVLLQAGARFSGGYILPPKPGSANALPPGLPGAPQPYHIVIRSDATDTQLPRPGARADPTYKQYLATLSSPSGDTPALRTRGPDRAAGATTWAYWLIGIELTVDAQVPSSFQIVQLGDGTETTVDDLPSNLVFDRCYIHGNPGQDVRHGVTLNSRDTIITETYIADCHLQRTARSGRPDSQAISCWNSPGPCQVINCYLEGGEENVLFGGQDPTIPGLVPSDFYFYGNFISKPLRWRTGDPSGYLPGVKNLFEFKNGQRVTLEGNVFENVWINRDQRAYAVGGGPRNEGGTAPQSTVRDITFRSNIIRHAGGGALFFGIDDDPSKTTQATHDITLENNLFYDIDAAEWGDQETGEQATGRWLLVEGAGGASGFTFTHNTVFQSGPALVAAFESRDGTPIDGLTMTNNLVLGGRSTIEGDGVGEGTTALDRYFMHWEVAGNVLPGADPGKYPPGNSYPPTAADVMLVDESGVPCSDPHGGLCKLANSSPYKHAGTDGKDPGCDLDVLLASTAVATTGLRTAPSSQPAHSSGGTTLPSDTAWQDYVANGVRQGIYVDVDTSSGQFTATPAYVSAIGGNAWQWATTGGSAIYSPTPTSFRVYVRWSHPDAGPNPATPPDTAFAHANGWYISWVAWGS